MQRAGVELGCCCTKPGCATTRGLNPKPTRVCHSHVGGVVPSLRLLSCFLPPSTQKTCSHPCLLNYSLKMFHWYLLVCQGAHNPTPPLQSWFTIRAISNPLKVSAHPWPWGHRVHLRSSPSPVLKTCQLQIVGKGCKPTAGKGSGWFWVKPVKPLKPVRLFRSIAETAGWGPMCCKGVSIFLDGHAALPAPRMVAQLPRCVELPPCKLQAPRSYPHLLFFWLWRSWQNVKGYEGSLINSLWCSKINQKMVRSCQWIAMWQSQGSHLFCGLFGSVLGKSTVRLLASHSCCCSGPVCFRVAIPLFSL